MITPNNVRALLLATTMLAISPAMAKVIKYPAKMQGAWCFKEKIAGADEYDRCGNNGEKQSFQIIGNEGARSILIAQSGFGTDVLSA